MQEEWWYASDATRKGPVPLTGLREKLLDGSLLATDLVWKEGMTAWTPLSEVPELGQILLAVPPELPQSILPPPLPPAPHLVVVAGPWRRIFARTIDLFVFTLPVAWLVVYAGERISPEFAVWLQQPSAGFTLGWLTIPLVLIVEAIIFGIFGSTPGKSLLRIQIKINGTGTPTMMQYLRRQIGVWWSGLGTGFPLVSLFAMWHQRSRLKSGARASYDEGRFDVTSERLSALRYLAVVVFVILIALVNSFLQISQSTPRQVVQSDEDVPSADPGHTFQGCTDCFEMVTIPSGSFVMGSLNTEAGRWDDEGPQRIVRVRSFSLGKYEVTQGQWKAVMGRNPSRFSQCGDDCPVERVSWNDIQTFIQRLNQQTGQQYRLPSEAEWEYAARAGSKAKWSFGDDESALGQHAWFSVNSNNKTWPVGQKTANKFGLYDMHGNVREWVQDAYTFYSYILGPTDGSALISGEDKPDRIMRGGSWGGSPASLRSAFRARSAPNNRVNDLGFRVARTVP